MPAILLTPLSSPYPSSLFLTSALCDLPKYPQIFSAHLHASAGTWVEGKFQSGVEFALPAKCPPKAAKFFGVEHMAKESFTKGSSDYFSQRAKEGEGEFEGRGRGRGHTSDVESPREDPDPAEVARSYAAALRAWADSKQTQTSSVQPVSAPECPLSPCSPMVSVTKPTSTYMRERVHSCSYGRLLLSGSTSDAKSDSKATESNRKISGKVGGGKGGGCGFAQCSKQDDHDYNGDSDRASDSASDSDSNSNSDDGSDAKRDDKDVRIEFTDVPLSPGLVSADGLTKLSTRRRTYASEDATSLTWQMTSECDTSERARQSSPASLSGEEEEEEASYRNATQGKGDGKDKGMESLAPAEEYKLALDAMRRLSDNLHNF
jgi:hypothetical protein